jgi:folate-dependent phosphoribosylglycinamide formyltransferase PurN
MRLVILSTSTLDDFQMGVLGPLWASNEVDIVGACIDRRPPVPRAKKLIRELKKGRGGYVLVMAFSSLARGAPATQASDYFRDKGVEVKVVDDLYGESTLAWLREKRPDSVFRTGFGIIREPVLSLAPKGVISFHHGNLRKYRGQPVGFWELYHGERELGVCVQVLTEELDAGRIVVQKNVPIHWSDTWGALERRAYAESRPMLHEACVLLDRPDFEPEVVPREELGTLFTTPNLRQWLTLQARVALRRMRARLR